jgi:hypothetical protein
LREIVPVLAQTAQSKSDGSGKIAVSGIRVFYGLVGAPLAWIIQICASEALAAQVCYPADHPLDAPRLSSLQTWIGAVSVVCIAVAIGGVITAWRSWMGLRNGQATNNLVDHSPGRPAHFLALVGVIASSIFLVGSLLTALAVLIVSPCRPW